VIGPRRGLLFSNKKIKSSFTRLIHFWVSRVISAQPSQLAPRPALQGCSGDESLATGGRFDRLEIWTPKL